MNTRFYFQNINLKTKEELKNYLIDKKVKRIAKLFPEKKLETLILETRSQYFKKHNAFSVKLKLKNDKIMILAEEKSHKIFKAIDLAVDRLISQIRKIENIKHKK